MLKLASFLRVSSGHGPQPNPLQESGCWAWRCAWLDTCEHNNLVILCQAPTPTPAGEGLLGLEACVVGTCEI